LLSTAGIDEFRDVFGWWDIDTNGTQYRIDNLTISYGSWGANQWNMAQIDMSVIERTSTELLLYTKSKNTRSLSSKYCIWLFYTKLV